MPIRFYTYQKKGYHYFLADLCYFVNLLLMLTIWVFPGSKRLFISSYCLSFGNNAIAIAMWRNSLVFHSLDKVTRYAFKPFKIGGPTNLQISVSSFISCLASLSTASSTSYHQNYKPAASQPSTTSSQVLLATPSTTHSYR